MRLPLKYFEKFSLDTVHMHCNVLHELPENAPVTLIVDETEDGIACTVLGYDFPFLFSCITGILAAHDLTVTRGEVFTYSRRVSTRKATLHRAHKRQAQRTNRFIIDYFEGLRDSSVPLKRWKRHVENDLRHVVSLLTERRSNDARAFVNEIVASHLASLQYDVRSALHPVDFTLEDAGPNLTRLRVVSQDTPAFLFTLSNALALQKISIEHVSISTKGTRVEDVLTVVDTGGKHLSDKTRKEQVTLAVLLTKQFTYFLVNAPDPCSALNRFENMLMNIIQEPNREKWLDTLANPRALKDLARLLGTSDFLWEDFIRSQYETILPMLQPHLGSHQFSAEAESFYPRLKKRIDDAHTYEEKQNALNTFKDNELYRIDLDHITAHGFDIHTLAHRMTALAEAVVRCAADTVYSHITERYGTPRTAADIETPYAIFGLGKFGGVALGYASDIELLFVYSDNGATDAEEPMDNGDFFHRFAKEFLSFIKAKREGVFAIDMRLRPFGASSPLSTSLENFCRYYGPDGDAHAYEKLALVRMRAVAGNIVLGQKVERLRDQFVYESNAINVADIRELRKKQCETKTHPNEFNAKFSPGALVDLEYDVQLLQVLHAARAPQLRTPYLHTALRELAGIGLLEENEAQRLNDAYYFLRTLINGLRMLRGNARDLLVPDIASDEFAHLARRMGYTQSDLSPAQQLRIDIASHTASVRTFVETHFGRDALPLDTHGTLADVVLSTTMPEDVRDAILISAGFSNATRAADNLKRIAGKGKQQELTARLAVLAGDTLSHGPDPDRALNNWERFVCATEHSIEHLQQLLAQPARTDILFTLFAGSQFLTDTLIQFPDLFEWITAPDTLREKTNYETLYRALAQKTKHAETRDEWLKILRDFRRREILRIGVRDLWLSCAFEDTVDRLSTLADLLISAALERAWKEILPDVSLTSPIDSPAQHLCILAFGKLGGNELNYSSDVDILPVCDDVEYSIELNGTPCSPKELYAKVVENMRSLLTTHTVDGYVYRVDFRLRPHGRAGELVPSVSSLAHYFLANAALWECQAGIKLRPVAGNTAIGSYAITQLAPTLYCKRTAADVAAHLISMRNVAIQKYAGHGDDIKSGEGGIRDIEFIVQGLQLIHAADTPEIMRAGTLPSLRTLAKAGCLDENMAQQLADDYIFLRHIEHSLQILEDRQVHTLPEDKEGLRALAKRVLDHTATVEVFIEQLNECRARVQTAYKDIFSI